MYKKINYDEANRHIQELDNPAINGDRESYRYTMSKDEETGEVVNQSYKLAQGSDDIISGLDPDLHHYITLALFNSKKTRTKRTMVATSGLYVDLDDALANISDTRIGLDLVEYAIQKAKLPTPTLFIHTGGGWHLYWLFKEIYQFKSQDDVTQYESVIESIIHSLTIIGADPRAKDATRLLRLAGTYNPKPEYGDGTGVYIVDSYDDRYTVADFSNIRTVKSLPEQYKPTKQSILLAGEEPQADLVRGVVKSPIKKQVKSTKLSKPEEFPMHLIGEIIVDAQGELQKKHHSAYYLVDTNQAILSDLLIHYIDLPRNQYTFEDGSTGQYVQVGSRNHFLWALARRGVTPEHLSIINKTLLLPSLNKAELNNAINLRRHNVPRIASTVNNLNLTLAEQSLMSALRLDYESLLDNHQSTVQSRIGQVISESNHQYILASKGKSSQLLADELGITTRRVNQLKKSKGVNEVMNRSQKIKELKTIYADVNRTAEVAIKELQADYKLVDDALDRIITNQSLIHNLRVELTAEQKADIRTRVASISAKVDFIISQLEAYSEFILDDSEYFKSGKVKRTVLLDKLGKLKTQVGLVTT